LEKEYTDVHKASNAIILRHLYEHTAEGQNMRGLTVYAHAVPIPEDAPPSVQIVEQAMRDYSVASALYHQQMEKLFQSALDALDGLEK
jgi:hypothetical protein